MEIDNSTPVGNLIGKGSGSHQMAQSGNPSNEEDRNDSITKNVKRWIVMPVVLFQAAGFAVLIWLCWEFIYGEFEPPEFVWPALIAAFAGIPFGFAANVKKLMEAVTIGSS